MQPVVISPTIQEFNGVRYYLCGKYFQCKGVRLHIQVWEHHCGPVPEGYHVHHKHSRSRNGIRDLECLTPKEHFGDRHGTEFRARLKKSRPWLRGVLAARAWHRSKAGQKWHSEHYEKHCRAPLSRRVILTCRECGAAFETAFMARNFAKFCGGRCRARDLRKRRRLA